VQHAGHHRFNNRISSQFPSSCCCSYPTAANTCPFCPT
jgi:hypothetical protein